MVHVKRFDVGQSRDVRLLHFLCDETKRKNLTKSEVKPVDRTEFSRIFHIKFVKFFRLSKLLIQNYITKMIRRIISGFLKNVSTLVPRIFLKPSPEKPLLHDRV